MLPIWIISIGSQQLGICVLEFFCNLTKLVLKGLFDVVCWGFVGFLELLATCDATSFVCTWDLKQNLETWSFGVFFLMFTMSSRSSLCFMYHYGLGLALFSFHCYNIYYSFRLCLFTIFDFRSQVWIQYHLLLLFFGVLFLVFLSLFSHKSILVKMESLSFQYLGFFGFWYVVFVVISLSCTIWSPFLLFFVSLIPIFSSFYFFNFVSHFSRFFSLIFLCFGYSCL